MSTIKVILDTDIGGDIDDAICLAYLLREKRCDLMGITTVCGDSPARASIADAVCRAAGRKIPIVAGADLPLQPIPVYPTPDGASKLAIWPHDTFVNGDAPKFIHRVICENPGEVVLISIGNMTNAAELFRRYPDSPALLRGFYMMNGYFGRTPLAEAWENWNAWADPLASKIAYAAQVPCHRSVPLNVTETLTVNAADAEALLPADSPLMRAVYDFGNAWLEKSEQLTLHDPLAAMIVFHPEVCTFVRGNVTVETEDASRMAATTLIPDENGSAEIAASADRALFYRILSETLREQ